MKTLVIGASPKIERYSNKALNMLHNFGQETEALGRRAGHYQHGKIDEGFPVYKNIDTVTLYVGPQNQEAYMTYIIGLKPRRVIFNPGTENPIFYKQLKSAKIEFEEACTLVLLGTGQYA
jgi:predicted CoA-binding protein